MKLGIVNDSSCPICGIDSESVIHILWSCSLAVNVLGACGKKIQKSVCSTWIRFPANCGGDVQEVWYGIIWTICVNLKENMVQKKHSSSLGAGVSSS
jgi:hypothetical protein